MSDTLVTERGELIDKLTSELTLVRHVTNNVKQQRASERMSLSLSTHALAALVASRCTRTSTCIVQVKPKSEVDFFVLT